MTAAARTTPGAVPVGACPATPVSAANPVADFHIRLLDLVDHRRGVLYLIGEAPCGPDAGDNGPAEVKGMEAILAYTRRCAEGSAVTANRP